MKTVQRTAARPDRTEADLGDWIRTVFLRCPELAGFAIFDLSAYGNDAVSSSQDGNSFAIQIDLSRPLASAECDQICEMISAEMDDLISSQPDAWDLLRGRAFARTLH